MSEQIPARKNGNGHVGHAVGDDDDYITRMARDPLIDAAKLSALVDVRIRVRAEERIEEAERRRVDFWEAFPAMQGELPIIGRDANNEQTRSRYARLETIWELCCPIWTKHGFVVNFNVASLDSGLMHITLQLTRLGHTETYTAPNTPPDTTGPKGTTNKTVVQGNQSAISYVKRGLLCNALGIVTRYEDDDGQSAPRPPPTKPAANRTSADDRRTEDDPPDAIAGSWSGRYFTLADQSPNQQAFMTVLTAALPSAPSVTELIKLRNMIRPIMEKAPRDVRNEARVLFDQRAAEFAEPPASDKKSDMSEDEQWGEDVITTVLAIETKSAFDAYAKTPSIQERMQRLSTQNRKLFEHVDRAFQNRHVDLAGAPE